MPEVERAFAATLAAEWHARPRIDLPPLFSCSHVVEFGRGSRLQKSRERLAELCRRESAPLPAEATRLHVVQTDPCLLRWEEHTECTTHSVFVAGDGERPFADPPLHGLDAAFGADLIEQRFVGVRIEVVRPPVSDPSGHALARALLEVDEVYGGKMSAGTATVWSSFALDSDGFSRILIVTPGGHDVRLSRLTQRLLDLESYRMLAMLGLPIARHVMASLSRFEPEMDAIMGDLADRDAELDEDLALDRITSLAAQVEHIAFGNAFRFAASKAYARIVEQRCAEIDEQQLGDHQRYTQFLLRSLQPAIRTCEAAEDRMQKLAEQTARAAGILDTRADLVQTQQSHEILDSVAQSARLQVKLQQAVEGFSIFAISYYAVGLLGYLAKSAKSLGVHVEPERWTGLAVPVVVGLVWWTVARVRRRIHAE